MQGISVLISVNLRKWQYKDFVDEDDNQVWDCMTEEWAEYMYGEGKQPSIMKIAPGKNKAGRDSGGQGHFVGTGK